MSNLTTQVIIAVVIHAVISALHGLAHFLIPVPISVPQAIFIGGVITVLPIIAALLIWRQRVQWALTVLLLSMTGSLLFGLYNHFVVISPDHISQLPPTPLGVLFQITAILLAVSEGIGIGVSLWGLKTR